MAHRADGGRGIHYVRFESTRHDANEIVAAVNGFVAAHGHCPETLSEVGITDQALHQKLGYSWYGCSQGRAHLGYHSTFSGFSICSHDFESGEWKCFAD